MTSVCHTLVLQVERWQAGLDEAGGQPAAPAGLAEVLLDPVEEEGVGPCRSSRLVEVNDARTGRKNKETRHVSNVTDSLNDMVVMVTRVDAAVCVVTREFSSVQLNSLSIVQI